MFENSHSAMFFTLFYGVFTFCFLTGPSDFRGLGLTVENMLSFWLGSEDIDFINFHMKRTTATVVIHSFIPLGYVLGIALIPDSGITFTQMMETELSIEWQIYISVSLLLFIAGCTIAMYWSTSEWRFHPLVANLSLYVEESDLQRRSNNVWRVKASQINAEYRRIDKFSTTQSGWSQVVVTSNWIISRSLYSVICTPLNKTTLAIFKTEEHDYSPESNLLVQFVNLRIKPTIRRDIKPHFVRILSDEFTTFKEHITGSCQIYTLPNVKVLRSTDERFLVEYEKVIKENPRHIYWKEVEQCIGCLQKQAEVKIVKNCPEKSQGDCEPCNCKPLWCADCLGKWYASRQNQSDTSGWLSGNASCPMCRSKFCLLDVALLT